MSRSGQLLVSRNEGRSVAPSRVNPTLSAASSIGAGSVGWVSHLQRTAGNQAVNQLLQRSTGLLQRSLLGVQRQGDDDQVDAGTNASQNVITLPPQVITDDSSQGQSGGGDAGSNVLTLPPQVITSGPDGGAGGGAGGGSGTITLPEQTIVGDPSQGAGGGAGDGSGTVTLPEQTIVGDPNSAVKQQNEDCKDKVDADVQGCLDEANTACSMEGAAIAGIGAIGGGMLGGPIGAGIGAVGGAVFGAYEYGECVKKQGANCRSSVKDEKQKCDAQFPIP